MTYRCIGLCAHQFLRKRRAFPVAVICLRHPGFRDCMAGVQQYLVQPALELFHCLAFNVVAFFEHTINTVFPEYQSRADLSARDSGTDYHHPVGTDKKAQKTGRTCLIHFLKPANLEIAGFFAQLSCR